jgi:hypothetical protein
VAVKVEWTAWFLGTTMKAGWMARFPDMVVKAGWTTQFPSMVVKVGRTMRFLGMAVKAGQKARFPGTSTWRRSEAPVWRHMWRAPGGGHMVEAEAEDAEEERAPAGVWWGNDRVRVQGLGHT